MSGALFELLLQSIWETIEMVCVSALISILIGLPLVLVLVATDDGGFGRTASPTGYSAAS